MANPMAGLDEKTMTSINEFLFTNQRTLQAQTFEILGQMVATLGPALEAMAEVSRDSLFGSVFSVYSSLVCD